MGLKINITTSDYAAEKFYPAHFQHGPGNHLYHMRSKSAVLCLFQASRTSGEKIVTVSNIGICLAQRGRCLR